MCVVMSGSMSVVMFAVMSAVSFPLELTRPWQHFSRISNSRQDFTSREKDSPRDQQYRQRVRASGSMTPRPQRAPDAARGHDEHCDQVAGEPPAAAIAVRPKEDADAERDRNRESQDRGP